MAQTGLRVEGFDCWFEASGLGFRVWGQHIVGVGSLVSCDVGAACVEWFFGCCWVLGFLAGALQLTVAI